MSHLWEIDHPFYGPDSRPNPCGSFSELRDAIDGLPEGMNHVYRFDWTDWSQPMHDDTFVDGEDRTGQELTVFLVLPRKYMLIHFSCPVTHDQEPEVLEWLRSDRILGALRRLWSPLLGEASDAG